MTDEQVRAVRVLRRQGRLVCDGGILRTPQQLMLLAQVTDFADEFQKTDPGFSRKEFFKAVHRSFRMYAQQPRRAA